MQLFFNKEVKELVLGLWVGACLLFQVTQTYAAIRLEEITPKPNIPEVGDNTVKLVVKDGNDQLVDGADIRALFYMPAMGAMPRMEEVGVVASKGQGVYIVTYQISMGGSWEIELNISKGSEKKTFYYSLTTDLEGITDKNIKRINSSDQSASGAENFEIGPRRLQLIGVSFSEAKVLNVERVIRAVGIVEQDRTHQEDVTIRYSGYIAKLFSGRVGDQVEKGQALFSIYSPELVTAQSEYLLASNAEATSRALINATEERLRNLGLSDKAIANLKKSGKPQRDIVMTSPIKGTILEINGSEGSAVNIGQSIVVVGDLSKTFIVARVFQQDIRDIKVGQAVEYLIPNSGAGPQKGNVDLVFPQIEQGTGTANVRVQGAVDDQNLKPGTYVDLRFSVNIGEKLMIPSDAIIYSGLHNYVFIDRKEGILEPREVFVGRIVGDLVEITKGLAEGERVVNSGTFLLSSEAQLRTALPKWSPN